MSHLQLRAEDGHTLSAYLSKPDGATRGAVVVVQEIFGVTGHIERVAGQFAAEGYLAIAPALFDRQERGVNLPYNQAGSTQGFALARATTTAGLMADLNAAVAWAQKLPDDKAKQQAFSSLGHQWAQADPQGAAAYALTLPAGEAVDLALVLLQQADGVILGMALEEDEAEAVRADGQADAGLIALDQHVEARRLELHLARLLHHPQQFLPDQVRVVLFQPDLTEVIGHLQGETLIVQALGPDGGDSRALCAALR